MSIKHKGIKMRILSMLILFLASFNNVNARGNGMSLIRDSEIEDILKSYAKPILEAAHLDPKALRIFIVDSKDINAFVAGGQNLFIHTGLIQKSKHPAELIGVMAHEIGHIAGGHLTRFDAEIDRASRTSLAGLLVGAAAALASKDPSALAVGGMAGMGMAQRGFLKFSRTQEASADQAAILFLEKSGQSPQGLYDMFKTLNHQIAISTSIQDPYLLSHPLTDERMRHIENACTHSPHRAKNLSPEILNAHKRLTAKLNGHLDSPNKNLRHYKEGDQSIESRYGRAIAYYKKIETPKAISILDTLINDYPEDPFFHELKGQILFEAGKTQEARPCYQKALSLKPDASLMHISLAQIELALPNPKLAEIAAHLEKALITEPENTFGWELLATAYGQNGDIGMAAYALAEKNMSIGNIDDAMQQVLRSEKLIQNKHQIRQKLQDIRQEIEYIRSKKGIFG